MLEGAGWIEKAAVAALGILVAFGLLRLLRKRRHELPAGGAPPGQGSQPSAADGAATTPLGILTPPSPKRVDDHEPERAPSLEAAPAPPVTLKEPDVAPPSESLAPLAVDFAGRERAWAKRIEDATAADDKVLLANHHLAYAKEEIAAGRRDIAADHLRACLRVAAQARNAPMEAHARMELAELARADDDLTTACEHWQIARSLFHTLASKPELADVEARMRTHGCPTDWVLTDF